MVKKIFVLIFICFLVSTSTMADKNESQQFNERVIKDIKQSFSEELKPLEDSQNVLEYNYHDLHKAQVAIGEEESHLNSLTSLFVGDYQGEMKLYIIGNQPSEKYGNSYLAYFLYKKTNGNNVLVELRKGKKEWEIVSSKEHKGKRLE